MSHHYFLYTALFSAGFANLLSFAAPTLWLVANFNQRALHGRQNVSADGELRYAHYVDTYEDCAPLSS